MSHLHGTCPLTPTPFEQPLSPSGLEDRDKVAVIRSNLAIWRKGPAGTVAGYKDQKGFEL